MFDTLDYFIVIFDEYFYLSMFFVFLFGLIMGSFHNVITSRMLIMNKVEGIENIIYMLGKEALNKDLSKYYKKYGHYNLCLPSSSCPSCGYQIKWWQNIPFFGYFIIGGKCYGCKKGISIQYPLVEILVAFSFVVIYYFNQESLINYLLISFLVYFLSIHLITDLKEKILFDSIHLIIFFISLIYLLINIELGLLSFGEFKLKLIGSFLFYFGLYSFIFIYEKIRNLDIAFGRGDIKLFSILLLWFNTVQDFIYFVLLSCFMGLICFVLLYLGSKKKDSQISIPFAPSIIISFGLMMLYLNI